MSVLAFPAAAMATEPSDVAARRDALDTNRSFLVEAPAGSGKTGLLILRYLCLLAVVDQPQAVLALTFTNKATAEMRHRILEALSSAQQPLPQNATPYYRELWTIARRVLDHDAAQGWHLLNQPHRLNIRTIDSLCGEIARAIPILSGGIGNATPVPDADHLYRAAARTVLLLFGGPDQALNHALEAVLAHRDADLANCETLLAAMLRTREQWGSFVPLSRDELDDATLNRDVLPRLNAALEHVLCEALSKLHRNFPSDALFEVARLAHLLAQADGYNGDSNPLSACATMPHSPGTAADDLAHWQMLAHLLTTSGGGWRKALDTRNLKLKASKQQKEHLTAALNSLNHNEELAALLCAVRDLPPRTYPPDQWAVAKALFTVLHHALVELRLLFAAGEVCDFTELSIAARTALDSGDSTAEALNFHLEHLLVDEMQDTSSAQYALLEALTTHWDGRTQTVFLVGDPKQSIYLFRQARVERFIEATRTGHLGDVPLTPLQLTSNFRSGSALVRAFNTTFSTVFAANGNIRFTAAQAALPVGAADAMDWQPTPLSPSAGPAEQQSSRREEAESIAAFAHNWRAKPLPPGRGTPWKIAVLVRSRTHAFATMRALGIAGVPFRAVELQPLGEQPEILDVLALTRALLHPADRIAWLAILRAPWCGVTVADLHTLAAGDQPSLRKQALRRHLRDRAEALEAETKTRVLHTLDVLDRALSQCGREPVSTVVDRAWTALLGHRTTSPLGRTNVRRYLELLESMGATGERIDAASLKARLGRLYAEPNPAPDAVEILTIHKAKGLEWDAVLLPGLHRTGQADTAPLLDWIELANDVEGRSQMLLAPIPKRGDDPDSLNRYLRKARTSANAAELQRLFYVAATRARTSLQLYASPNTRQNGTLSVRKNSLLHAAWPAAEPYFNAAPPAPAKVVPFPIPISLPHHGLSLAAAAADTGDGTERNGHASQFAEQLSYFNGEFAAPQRQPDLKRIPLYLLSSESPQPSITHPQQQRPTLARPQGSLEARVLGTTIHAFLQLLATTRRQLSTPALLLQQVQDWTPRIHTFARGSGLPPRIADHITRQTSLALYNTLVFPPAAWLFSPHRDARDEGELIGLTTGPKGEPERFRFDRSFLAGPAPAEPGEGILWIVDYKTSTYHDAEHSGQIQQEFLARERAAYQPQLEQYARLLLRRHSAGTPVMLALYYPLLPYLDIFAYQP